MFKFHRSDIHDIFIIPAKFYRIYCWLQKGHSIFDNKNLNTNKRIHLNMQFSFIMIFFLHFVDDCYFRAPCLNGGVCENDACTCAAEFTGSVCDRGNMLVCVRSMVQTTE